MADRRLWPGPRGPFQDPLGEPTGERELIFTLPNGLLGHVLADAGSNRIDVSQLLSDPDEEDSAYRIAVSAFRKHAGGVQVFDEVREFVLQNPRRFDAAVIEKVQSLYPAAEELAAIVAEDRDTYGAALARLGIDIEDPEPIGSFLAGGSTP